MSTNLGRYKKDLDELLQRGTLLHISLVAKYHKEHLKGLSDEIEKSLAGEIVSAQELESDSAKKVLLDFDSAYQGWYSEAKVLIKQLLPDRLADFTKYYESPKTRKLLSPENLRKLGRGGDYVGPSYALVLFNQQFHILQSIERRFESSLFEIKQLVQADLFDSELDAAKELLKNGFARAAGAIAGVVLEKHLYQVSSDHALRQTKKHPGINDWNQLLKDNGVIEQPTWRRIQFLADIRNLCDHNKGAEPTMDQLQDLISGVDQTIKTVH